MTVHSAQNSADRNDETSRRGMPVVDDGLVDNPAAAPLLLAHAAAAAAAVASQIRCPSAAL
jgi:hypothetical protein